MESDQCSLNNHLCKLVEELKRFIDSSNIDIDNKKEILSFIEKLKEIKEDKINLIFFGMNSTGKTSSVNLILIHLMKKNLTQLVNKSFDEDEVITFPTSESENTYFFTFVESSENNNYQIEINFNKNEEKFFQNDKYFKNKIIENKIVEEFQNTKEGLNSLNKFLETLFDLSSNLLEMIRRNEISEMKNDEKRTPSKLTIRIPHFPKEYRLIDTPNFSLKIFTDDFLKILEELISINVFILVQNIDSKVTYNNDREICRILSNEFSPAIFYSFYTKGESFLNKYENINLKNSRDYEKSLKISKIFFDYIEDFSKDLNIIFRKIIAIIDNSYKNDDVKKSICNFFDDLCNKLLLNLNKKEFIFREIIKRFYNFFNKNFETTDESIKKKELENIEKAEKKALEECENENNQYFTDLGDYENFKNKYPDYYYKLKETFLKNDNDSDIFLNRKNYIQKDIRNFRQDFLKIMLDRPERNLNRILQLIDLNDKDINKIKENTNFFDENELQINKINLKRKPKTSRKNPLVNYLQTFLTGISYYLAMKYFFPNHANTRIFITSFILSFSLFKNYIGFWTNEEAQDDIFRGLYENLIENTSKFIEYAKNIISNKFNQKKIEINRKLNSFENKKKLLKILNNHQMISEYNLDNSDINEKYSLISYESLKNFITNANNLNN